MSLHGGTHVCFGSWGTQTGLKFVQKVAGGKDRWLFVPAAAMPQLFLGLQSWLHDPAMNKLALAELQW